MVHNLLKHIGGIQHYGIISLCLFCAIFLGILVWAFIQKQSHLDYMSQVALDPEDDNEDKSHE